MKSTVAKLLDVTERSVYNWSKESRPIITFLYKYFSKEDLQEYLEYGKIEKLELLNLSDPLDLQEFQSLSIILHKIENYVHINKINREGFLIKIYRALRDFNGETTEEFIDYVNRYDMHTIESLRNVIYASSLKDIINFYENYLSKEECKLLFARKFHILPTLKTMRKHNAHLKD